jgi:hypothetical protein
MKRQNKHVIRKIAYKKLIKLEIQKEKKITSPRKNKQKFRLFLSHKLLFLV